MREIKEESNDVIIKTCFIPELDKTEIKDTAILLQIIRLEVRAAKLADRQLENYSLHDMGFVQKERGMEIKLYFRPREAV
jgi:hypothetical protein